MKPAFAGSTPPKERPPHRANDEAVKGKRNKNRKDKQTDLPRRQARFTSNRQRASRRLAQLYRLAIILRAAGEILPLSPWLRVLADALSSAKPGPINEPGSLHGRWFGLDFLTLKRAAEKCGFDASDTELEKALNAALRYRSNLAARSKRLATIPMRGDKIARLLGITAEVRKQAAAWSIGAIDQGAEERKALGHAGDLSRWERIRRTKGQRPRADYLAGSVEASKPWIELGISRATWFRRKAASEQVNLSSDPEPGETDRARETGSHGAISPKVTRVACGVVSRPLGAAHSRSHQGHPALSPSRRSERWKSQHRLLPADTRTVGEEGNWQTPLLATIRSRRCTDAPEVAQARVIPRVAGIDPRVRSHAARTCVGGHFVNRLGKVATGLAGALFGPDSYRGTENSPLTLCNSPSDRFRIEGRAAA